jgi:glycyl-tRNA synthetase
MEIFDEATKSKIIPHVIEPSLGLERFMMAVLYEAYREDESRGNIVLSLPPILSPIQVGVFPLMNKEELTLKAREIFNDLLDQDIKVIYDKSGSVGKRYARSDEIGIPFCVTIDYESIEDGELKDTVTIRDRESTSQKRVRVDELGGVLRKLISGNLSFDEL